MPRPLRPRVLDGNRDVVLVDTSVWITELRKAGFVARYVTFSEIAVCPPVIQEVLQGIRDESLYKSTRAVLLSVAMFESPMSKEVFEQAADIYRTGRAIGISIRSAYDCLIAACALRNDAEVLHSDRDFNTIARFTRLQSRYVAL
ncbi:MAG: PIN domain-containing protein [Acidobacteriota bacterium]|nr:PIN domain-containing protein [Acidobacteriota bacterium]